LVWDKLAQFVAIATTEWLDALPLFGEPIAHNFLDKGNGQNPGQGRERLFADKTRPCI
jgi:hypothetical protein